MTAATAVGEPPTNPNTSALPSFTNDDDEGPFSPTICDSPFASINQNSRGTQHHVEKHVPKFHPRRSAARNHHDPRRSAPPPTTSHNSTNTPKTCAYDPYDHRASTRNKKQAAYDCHPTPAAHHTPLAHTAYLPATNHNSNTPLRSLPPPDPRIDSLLALQRQILQDLTTLMPTTDSNANNKPLPPMQTTMTTPTPMTTMRPHSQVWMLPSTPPASPTPPDYLANPPPTAVSPLSTATDPPDGAIMALQALQRQILCDMQDLDHISSPPPQAITFRMPPDQPPQPLPCQPSPSTLPATTSFRALGPHHTTQLPQPHLTATARMILNNTRANSTIWTPSALKRCILTLTLTSCWLPDLAGPLILTAAIPTHAHNPPANNYTNSNHTTVCATCFPWQATCQRHHQYPPYIPLATNIKVLAHIMRPP